MSKTESRNKQKGKNKKTIIIICILAVIAILLGIILFLLLRGDEKRNVVVNKDNAEEIAKEMADQEFVEPGYYTVSMETEWHFSKGDAVSDNAWVENQAENTNDVYFDVFLAEDEDKPIYQSPVIPRGSYLENITLDQSLDKGTHDCVIIYHLVDEEQETISTLRVAFTITVDS